jgi:dTDP-4-amino-4,6-dideoxygalactose transaminase
MHAVHGLRANMDEFNAAVIRLQLAHLEEWSALRRERAGEHAAGLANLAPAVRAPVQLAERVSAYWQYCLRCESRELHDVLHTSLRARDIETAHYPCVLSEQPSITSGRRPYRVTPSQTAEKAVGEQI